MKNFTIILMFIFWSLYSCDIESVIEYDVNFTANKPVLNGIISVKGIRVLVSETVPSTELNADNQVQNALISLYADNVFLFDLEKSDDGYYQAPEGFQPNYGTAYRLEAEIDEYKKITTAEQYLPVKVELDTAYYSYDNLLKESLQINYAFIDPENQVNYYSDRFYRFGDGENLDKSNFDEFINPYTAYSDEEFSGCRKMISNFIRNSGTTQSGQTVGIDSAQIILYSLSPDFYKYLSSVRDYETTNQDPWFEQPAVVYTNIENGYGIFAAFSADTLTVNAP